MSANMGEKAQTEARAIKVQVVDPWIWDAIIKGETSLRRGVMRIDFINRIIVYRGDEIIASMVKEFVKARYFSILEASA